MHLEISKWQYHRMVIKCNFKIHCSYKKENQCSENLTFKYIFLKLQVVSPESVTVPSNCSKIRFIQY